MAAASLRGLLRNDSTGETLAVDACLSRGFLDALIGLIGRRSVPPEFALGIGGCDQVHTFGVRFPIDVAYCDSSGRVLCVVSGLRSGRIAPRAPGARVAWEMRAGGFTGRVSAGDILVLD